MGKIKEDLDINQILVEITGRKDYCYCIDEVNQFIEYGTMHFNSNGFFYLDNVGVITFNELKTYIRENKLEKLLN